MPGTVSSAKAEAALRAALAALNADSIYRVAYSGGRDSSVLLHALSRLRPELALEVMHVNHAIHPDAAAWAEHGRAFCAHLGLTLDVQQVCAPAPTANLEAWAREQRYALLAHGLTAKHVVLTAHHRDDQVETVLLNLLRGSGVDGLSAMPATRPLGVGQLQRPLLDVDAQCIAAYAEAHQLSFVDDPSNASMQHDRNFLRHQIVPRLLQRFPQAAANIARSAGLLSQQRQPVSGHADELLLVSELREQAPAVRNQLLRVWLRNQGFAPPRFRMLDDLWRQILSAAPDAQPVVRWPGAELRRYRDHIFVMAPLGERPVLDWPVAHAGSRVWPAGGRVHWSVETQAPVRIASPQGGEMLRFGGMQRRLKNLYQQAGVPPWQRARDPLLWAGDELLAVGNRWRAETGLVFEWSWELDEIE